MSARSSAFRQLLAAADDADPVKKAKNITKKYPGDDDDDDEDEDGGNSTSDEKERLIGNGNNSSKSYSSTETTDGDPRSNSKKKKKNVTSSKIESNGGGYYQLMAINERETKEAHDRKDKGKQKLASSSEVPSADAFDIESIMEKGTAYRMDIGQVVKVYGTSIERGLSKSEVEKRAQQYGPNEVEEGKAASVVWLFLKQFLDFMMAVLIVATILSLIMKDWADAGILGVVIISNALIGFSQEYKAERTIASLKKMAAPHSTVLRDGHLETIEADKLVPGDIVILEEGNQIPADLRIVDETNLQIEESILTGESMPVEKEVDTIDEDVTVADRKNMAFSGTFVTAGRAKGIVTSIGRFTQTGKIAERLKEKKNRDQLTPLQKKLTKLGRWLVFISIGLCALVAILGVVKVLWKGKEDSPEGYWSIVKSAISLAVSVIPEGLVAVVSVTMAIGVKRMARRNAIVRRLHAAETLGSVTAICSDKTGTITQGVMVVTDLWLDGTSYKVTGIGTSTEGDIALRKDNGGGGGGEGARRRVSIAPTKAREQQQQQRQQQGEGDAARKGSIAGEVIESPLNTKEHPTLNECLTICTLCNNAEIKEEEQTLGGAGDNNNNHHNHNHNHCYYNQDQDGNKDNKKQDKKHMKTVGDPTEVALRVLAAKAGMDKHEFVDETHKFTFLNEIPFETERMRMSVIYRKEASEGMATKEKGGPFVYTKGAVESMLNVCSSYLKHDAKVEPMTEERKEQIKKQNDIMAAKGLRVLALAYKQLEDDGQDYESQDLDSDKIEKEMVFVGLVGVSDPPRKEAIESIKKCHNAGITVYMITGDHPATAQHIAEESGIFDPSKDKVLTGKEIDKMDEEQLAHMDPVPKVFARVSPDNKLHIVAALKKQGNFVAMTGDGVNDAPSIKAADVGVAMGKAGSDVAKQAADIILTDDNFSTIVDAIEMGRQIWDNIEKFIIYLLSCNSAEIFVMLFAQILSTFTNLKIDLPFSAIQILWLNLVTDTPPAFAIGLEPKEPDIMDRKPRDPSLPVFTLSTTINVIVHGIAISMLTLGVFLWTDLDEHTSLNLSRTNAFVVLATLQLVHAFNVRHMRRSIFRTGILGNWWLIGAFFLSTGMMLAGIYVPFLARTFEMEPMGWINWAVVGITVVVFMAFAELYKLAWKLVRKVRRRTHPELRDAKFLV